MFKNIGILSVCALVAGCGGRVETAIDNLERAEEANAMLTSALLLEETAPEDMPVSGSAVYNGYALIVTAEAGSPVTVDDFGDENGILGDVQITANFGTGTVDGEMTNFISQSDAIGGDAYTGQISIMGAIDSVEQNLFEADMRGALTDPNGDTLNINGDLYGAFVGADAGTIAAASLEDENISNINGTESVSAVVIIIAED
ncbi:MAG: transferrin-binding protein-like solute binding protein [Rhodobacteraceae bacterium]|nr:transferrin-binding protein-like solute binding protein [Paracoccaceae bacterium]